jgi:hypothetical protein
VRPTTPTTPNPDFDEQVALIGAKTTAKRPKIERFVTLYRSGESDTKELAHDAGVAPGTAQRWLTILEESVAVPPVSRQEMVDMLAVLSRSPISRDVDKLKAIKDLSSYFGWDKPDEAEQTPFHHRIASEGIEFLDDTIRAIIDGATGGPAFKYPEGVTIETNSEPSVPTDPDNDGLG